MAASAMVQGILKLTILKPILKPLTRLFVGVIAVPVFRLFMRRGMRLDRLDHELEKDLEQWFRGALILLIATANMERTLFGWVPIDLQGEGSWVVLLFRLLLAVSVIEAMPDQKLFAILHPGPPKLDWKQGLLRAPWRARRAIAKGLLCQHINRSSAVFAIMAAIFGGTPGSRAAWVGWICYGLAVIQYLVIGLVTSRDKAIDVIAAFDRSVAEQREDLLEEFLEEEEEEEEEVRESESGAPDD